ncbi:MAG: flagellar hook-basal body complex protein FliE [Pseudomonadota bacterium]
MNDLAINSVLSQMRALRAQSSGIGAASASTPLNGAPSANFSDTLKNAIGSVAESQNASSSLATRFELGDDSVNLSDVMLAGAKSQVQFRGAVEVRNRLVSAYQDVMNMPI